MAGKRIDLSELGAALKTETKSAVRAIEGGVYLAANNIIAQSIREVPKDTGALRSSNFVSHPKRAGNEITVRFGYGGMAARYALFVHEMPAGTNWTTGGTGPKYLERPLNAAKPRIGQEISKFAARLLKQGRGFSPAPGRRDEPK
jgi:hypothetical protein